MEAINYFKFDLRLIKEGLKYYLLIPAIFAVAFMFTDDSYILGTSYLYLFLIIFATIPFSMQGNEKSTQMYYMFPCKISSMVLGRFLYLISITIVMFLINGINVAYLYKTHVFNNIEIISMFVCGIMSLLTCLIQYPIYYKFGMEKGKAISMIIYLVPAFVVFGLPSFLISSDYFLVEELKSSLNFIINNKIIALTFSSLSIMLIGYISYLISCRICKEKEI